MRIILLCCCSILSFILCQGQDRLQTEWGAYAELYVGWDDLRSKSHNRPSFFYNHPRTDEVGLNLALIQATLSDTMWRVKGGLMAGHYVNRNLATEPAGLRSIYEATLGLRLRKDRDIWIDVGIFPSHLGYESVIGLNSPTLTRSLIAENSPYYESGIQLNGTSRSKKWRFMLGVLNGWQRIARPAGHYLPALGGQLAYRFNDRWQLSYSNYFGDESSDDDVALRQFHDVFLEYVSPSKMVLIVSGDIGLQPNLKLESRDMAMWYGGTMMLQRPITNRIKINGRLELYRDEEEIVADNPLDESFFLKGYSLGFDCSIHSGFWLRAEAKRFDSPHSHFVQNDSEWTNVAHMLNVSLCWKRPG